jgi:hypothetical protein
VFIPLFPEETTAVITIPRALARTGRAVFRRLAGRAGPPPAVELLAGAAGLRLRCQTPEVAAEYHLPGGHPDASLVLPLAALADCEGRDDSPVTLRPSGKAVEARWESAGVPHLREYATADQKRADWPEPPARFTANPASLLAALAEAVRTASKEPARFALHRLLLRGRAGELVASDGKQVLVQGGFRFPFGEDLLVPRAAVFLAQELVGADGAGVGRTDTHVAVRAGPWTVWLAIDTGGRFPDVTGVVPPASAATRWLWSAADRAALPRLLAGLPAAGEMNSPVTVDLNGHAAVRARAEGQPRSTELVLAGSRVEGKAVRACTDRTYLARAAALGFEAVGVAGPDRPLACRDATRTYAWMALDPAGVLAPQPDDLRVAAGGEGTEARTNGTAAPPAKVAKTNTAGKEARTVGAAKPVAGPDLAAEAEAVRQQLKAVCGRLRNLAEGIRRQRRQQRLVRSTLDSLRQLHLAGG